jgi:hypothetical protein
VAGDGLHFFDPEYMIPKRRVDDVGEHIDAQRQTRPKICDTTLPNEALDECERSHEAADGRKQKTSMDHFDDTGLMALVCRHDVPLFLANIDTPGEQQKYAVALLEELFSHLPTTATVGCLYDVGCQMHRSRCLVNFASFTHACLM